VLHETRHLEADCPRFLDLLAQFSGQIDVRITRGQARHVEDCFVVVDALHLIRRPVASQPRGVLLENDPAAAATQLERYEQIQCESDPGLEAGSLGLD
jgi:hypothetical protein